MYQFQNDYTGGCFPKIIEKLLQSNCEELPGYCSDIHCKKAEQLILRACNLAKGRVFWVNTGTLANLCVLSTILPSHGGVVCTDSAHICTGEAGAIEATGHKLLLLKGKNGKLSARDLDGFLGSYFRNDEIDRSHKVRPAAVYITQPTEWGTVYRLYELKALRQVCNKWGLFLYLDGARLAYSFPVSDVSMADIAQNTDVFYIGGTKCGTINGEAIVVGNRVFHDFFLENIRMRGGLISKGRLIGCQFECLFEDGMYMRLASDSLYKANSLRTTFMESGFKFYVPSITNQIFPLMRPNEVERLEKDFCFRKLGKTEFGEIILRFCTSWSTSNESVEALKKAVRNLKRSVN